jgi:hypothetical protein
VIETKIARIISPTQVVLAAGSAQGVREGMHFLIFELSEPINDPETGESLGQLELVKGRVKVAHVQEKMSYATTLNREISRSVFPSIQPFLPREWKETVYDQLPVEGAVALQTDLKVRVGDRVRSVE